MTEGTRYEGEMHDARVTRPERMEFTRDSRKT